MKRKLLKTAAIAMVPALICLFAFVVCPAGEVCAADSGTSLAGYKVRDVSKTYGDPDPKFVLEDEDGNECEIPSLEFTREEGEDAGRTYTVSVNGGDFGDVPSGTLTINKRAATVRVNDVSKKYGADDPTFSYGFKVGGLAPGDAVAEGKPEFSREEGEDVKDVGGYAIEITEFPVKKGETDVSNNYDFTFEPGVLTIEKKKVEARSATMNVQYGDTDLKPEMEETIDDFFGNKAHYDFHGLDTMIQVPGSRSVEYDVRFEKDGVDTTGTMEKNLDISRVFGIMKVSKKQITVTPLSGNTEVVYGTEPDIGYSVEIGGDGKLADGHAMAGRLSRESASTRDVGEYAVTLGDLRVVGTDGYTDMARCYDVTLAGSSTVTIKPKAVSVDFGSGVSAVYGEPEVSLAPFDALLKGQLCDGDGAGIRFVRGNAYETAVGKYAIQLSDSLGENYEITLINSEYVIEKREITVEPAVLSKTYGDPEPDYGYRIAGGSFVSGETRNISFTREEGEKPGSYEMRLVPVELQNYEVRTRKEPFSFKIEKKVLTIKGLIAAGRVWDGTANVSLYRTENFGLSGIVGEDDVRLADGMLACFETPEPGENKPVILSHVSLEGEDRAGYKVADPMLMATVTPLEITDDGDGNGVTVTSENETVIKNGTVLKTASEVARTRRGFAGEKSGLKLYGVVLAKYAVSMVSRDGETYLPDGYLSYAIDIPERFGKLYGLKVSGRTEDGKAVLMDSREENGRLVFSTDKSFVRFEIVSKDESWIYVAAAVSCGAALLCTGAAVLARSVRKRRGVKN